MSQQFRILIVEDVATDTELMLRELKRAGIRCDAHRVETPVDYRRELEEFQPHVILSDFAVPRFDGMEALRIARQSYPHIPFVFVSGTLGEEHAVRALKNGAADFVLKNNLLRLPAAVARAIKEAEERRARQTLEHQLRESEKQYHALFQSNPHPMWVYGTKTLRFLAVNDTAVARYGFSREEFLAMTIKDIRPEKDLPRLLDHVAKPLPMVNKPESWQHRTKSGELIEVEIASHDLLMEGRPARIVVAYDISERKRAEEGLLRFRMAMETSLDGIFLMDFETFRYLDVNETGCSMLGYSRDELLTMTTMDTNLDVSEADQRRRFEAAKALGSEHVMIEPAGRFMRRKDGSTFPIEVARRYLRIGEKEIVVGIARDITERRRAEEALRESEYRLDLALAASGLATWEWTFSTREVRFSQHWWPILGYQPQDIPLRIDAWEELTHPDDLKRVKSIVAAAAKGSIPVLEVEYRMRAKNAEWRWIRSVGRVVERDAAGLVVRMTGTHGDITERKQNEQRLLQSEAKYRQLIEQAADGIFISDAEGNFLIVNARGCELLGYTQSELIGLNGKVTYLEGEKEIHSRRMGAVVAGKVLRFERMVKRKDGTAFPAEVSLKMLDNGTAQVIFHDITERRNQEKKIARLSRIQQVLSGINSAIVRIRDRRELFQEVCRIIVEHGRFTLGWIAMLDHATGKLTAVAQAGLPENLGAGSAFFNGSVGLVPALTAEIALREKHAAIDNAIEDTPGLMDAEHESDTLAVRRAAIKLGAKSVIVLPLFVEGQTFGILTLYAPERNFFDDEELKLLKELAGDVSFGLEFIAKEEKVDYLAYYDPLTGLPNRSLFSERLSQQLHTRADSPELVAVALVDVERLRLVNDTMGRQAGDEVLRLIARRLESNAAMTHWSNPARVVGDSFGVIIRGARDANELAQLIEQGMKACFGVPFVIDGKELRLVARAGVSAYPTDGSTAESLLRNAESALRNAKRSTERFVFYAPEINAQAAEFLLLETKLHKAIELEQFVLHYQPKFDAATGITTGVEALIRWNDPDTGMVPPLRFIHILEETGMIFEVGRWALRQALADQQRWRGKGLTVPRVAVNVSARQLRDPHFVRDVQLALASQEGLMPALELEITESLLMEDIERNIERLKTLRDLGVTIAMDDFGTGYSSLNYLARLPMDTLKIDRSFVLGMAQSPVNWTIVSTIISLAHSLGLKVVAEGVETEEQLHLLRLLKCDEMQGFLLGRPVASDEIATLLSR
jgi:diguanylate cyclase (GGDEF)-like protein/PAS domain S-box-containing protein